MPSSCSLYTFYYELHLKDSMLDIYTNLDSNLEVKKYIPISEFPSSNRDFSFLIKNNSTYPNFIDEINNINNEILKEAFIFDFFENIKKNEIKIGVRMIFQSNQKTLSDEEINKNTKKILEPILKIDGVSIPGM